jgi:hypothetical protein
MRFGRGVDNRKLKATGFNYLYTSREAVLKLAEHQRLHPVVRGAQEPYRYEREVEDFLRWSPYVRNPAFRKEGRLKPEELVDLQKTLSSYGERVGSPGGTGSRASQAEAVTRAAQAVPAKPKRSNGAGETKDEAPEPAAPTAPVEHYDDLEPDAIVGLIGSLEPDDLTALLDYERASAARPRIISAIEGVLTRREAGRQA